MNSIEDFMKMVSSQNLKKSNEKFMNNQSFLAKLKQNYGENQHNQFMKQSFSQIPKNEESLPLKPLISSINSTSPKSSPKRPSIFSLKNSEDIFRKLKLPQSDLEKLNEGNQIDYDKVPSIDLIEPIEKQVTS